MANNVPYGFIDLQTIQNRTLATVNPMVIMDAVEQSLTVHNQEVNALLDAWVEPTTEISERFKNVETLRMQPVTESGQAKPVRTDNKYTVAYPLKRFEHAWGTNMESMAEMTVADVQFEVAQALIADRNTVKLHLLAAILDNTTWTYPDPKGDQSIKPLANNDTDKYVVLGGGTSTANHYGFQNATIADANNPFPTIFNALRNYPSNMVNSSFPVISFVAPNLTTDVQALTALIPPRESDVIYNATDVVNRQFDAGLLFGDMYLGKVNNVHIIEWQSLPSDYVVSWATGAGKFLKMRQKPQAEMQGLVTYQHSVDGNSTLNFYRRVFGFGAYKRFAAHVMHIDNASYAVPTGYTASSDILA